MAQALASYPPYAPPRYNPDPTPESMRAASAQYEEYFLGSMPARLEALRAFLANFDVALNSDDTGLRAVSTWMPQWADLLVDDLYDSYAIDRLDVPWTGALSGLNVIFDLGVYYSDCLWARRTKLGWFVYRGPDANGQIFAGHSIKGIPGGKLFDPFHFMYGECWSIRQAKIAKEKKVPHSEDPFILSGEALWRHLLANAPPGRRSRKSKHVASRAD
jgi:hypothetical protein